jgi:DNA-binding NarL/FixJ family response regulator
MTHAAPIRVAVLRNASHRLDELGRRVLEVAPEVEFTRIASTWDELVDADGTIPADILLLDHQLEGDGTAPDLIRRARAVGTRVITLTSLDDPKAVMSDMAAGADAALRKSDSSRRLVEQIRLAAHRDRLIRERATR